MTVNSLHHSDHLYFVTASIIDWKHLFAIPEYTNITINSLAWLQVQNRILLFSFVIMPSHLHFIIKPQSHVIGEILQQFGSHTAHEILKKLKQNEQKELLTLFQEKRRDQRHDHSIWQDIQAKNIYSAEFLWQKMEYIHMNPVAKDWNLAKDRADYPYSSAGYYDYGRKSLIELTDINEWLGSIPPPFSAEKA